MDFKQKFKPTVVRRTLANLLDFNQGEDVGGSNERCPPTSNFDAKKFTK